MEGGKVYIHYRLTAKTCISMYTYLAENSHFNQKSTESQDVFILIFSAGIVKLQVQCGGELVL